VGFGAKAALRQYPRTTTLIYWAPGLSQKQTGHAGAVIKIHIIPRPETLLNKLKEMQPGMKTLLILFISEDFSRYIEEMRLPAARLGIKLRITQLNAKEELPERLRAAGSRPDAVWLAPDPALIDQQSFTMLKEYSWANVIPLYAASSGLVEQGATASVAADFSELGRIAAQSARKALKGNTDQDEIYSETLETAVNLTAAEKTGVVFTKDFLKTVRKVFP